MPNHISIATPALAADTRTGLVPFHPLADIFPMMLPKYLGELADDIAARGLQDPIIMHEGMILDGRNRYQACIMAGVDHRFEEFDSDDPLAFVVSSNLHRRHLDETQRAVVAAKLANIKNGGDRVSDQSANLQSGAISQSAAAAILDVSTRSVASASKVLKEGASELVDAVEQGVVSISAAAAVAGLPIEEQREIVAAGPAAVRKSAKKIRETPKEIVAEVVSSVVEMPEVALEQLPQPRGRRRAPRVDPVALFKNLESALDAMSSRDVRAFQNALKDYMVGRRTRRLKRRIADFEASEKALGEFVNKHVVVAEDDPIEGVAA